MVVAVIMIMIVSDNNSGYGIPSRQEASFQDSVSTQISP